MLTALLTLAVAVSLSTLMQASWQLVVLCGVLVDLGYGAMALVLGATVAARWFVQRRGLVTGLSPQRRMPVDWPTSIRWPSGSRM